jgi:hypothetical protein
MRHTTFRFALDPTPAQERAFARHAGASRFAYNQSLRLMTDALVSRRTDPSMVVPRSGFDLINTFNAWKKTEEAGRIFVVAPDKTVTKLVTGLAWRHEVAAQVFEEAAVDLRRALATFLQGKARSGNGAKATYPAARPASAPLTGTVTHQAALTESSQGHPYPLPSTPGLLAYGETSSTRRPATLPRPTAGWPSRTSQ